MTTAEVLTRGYPCQLRLAPDAQAADGRVLEGRLVPYGETADVTDATDQGMERYREAFQPGAFAYQVGKALQDGSVARRVTFVDQHQGGLGKLGYALGLEERADGLYGELRVLPRQVDNVEQLLADGVDGLSVGFVPIRSQRTADGTRLRTRCHLVHVALEAVGAYSSARVLAMRGAEDELEEVRMEERAALEWEQELEAWMAQAQERADALHARLQT
jgi:HK97 family phage prohead protease